jgi:replicative DNA helicase
LRLVLSDLRESGSIEQDADMVAFVFREEYYKRFDASLHGLAELILAKAAQRPHRHRQAELHARIHPV